MWLLNKERDKIVNLNNVKKLSAKYYPWDSSYHFFADDELLLGKYETEIEIENEIKRILEAERNGETVYKMKKNT